MTEIVISIITGVLTLAGVCITAWASAKKTRDDVTQKLAIAQSITDTKLEELTREVREHNHFAQKVPVLESKLSDLDRRLSAVEKHA